MIKNYSVYKKAQNKRSFIKLFVTIFFIVAISIGFEVFNKLNEEKTIRKEEIQELLTKINPNIDNDFLDKNLKDKTKFDQETLSNFTIYIIEDDNDNFKIKVLNESSLDFSLFGDEASQEAEFSQEEELEIVEN
jgi:hypothetical protein